MKRGRYLTGFFSGEQPRRCPSCGGEQAQTTGCYRYKGVYVRSRVCEGCGKGFRTREVREGKDSGV